MKEDIPVKLSDCCKSEMIPPDWETADRSGSLWRAYACYICKKCGKPCEVVIDDKTQPNTFIKPSKIHGLGLFAKYDIKVGDYIVQGVGDFTYQDEWIIYNKTHKVKSFNFTHGLCMINHSDSPNTIRIEDMEHLIATVSIPFGKEITEDYYQLPNNENPFIGIDLGKKIWDAKNNQWED